MNLIPQSNSPYRLIPKYLLPYFHFEYWEKIGSLIMYEITSEITHLLSLTLHLVYRKKIKTENMGRKIEEKNNLFLSYLII